MLEKLYNAIPPQIKNQQPVIFRDALNRVTPIHLEWTNSHEAFLAGLEIRFKDLGLQKIRRKEFALQRAGSNRDIDLNRPWEICFCPGQRVDMSMVFSEFHNTNMAVCPACQHECFGETGAEVEWYVLVFVLLPVADTSLKPKLRDNFSESDRRRGHCSPQS
jgi:hypothetical protein